MLKFHFQGPDYGRVLLRRPNPLWELALSLHVLANGSGRPSLQVWRRRASRKLEAVGLARDVQQLMCLVPEAPYFPDFLTPDAQSWQRGLQAVAATPMSTLTTDLEQLAEVGPIPAIATGLHMTGVMERLVGTLEAYHAAVIAPTWPTVRQVSEKDLQWRCAVLQTRGVLAVLGGFDPTVMSFSEPVLSIKSPHGDVELSGRGVALVPSYFCRRAPISNRQFEGQPSIVYQAGLGTTAGPHDITGPLGASAAGPANAALVKLIGSSRSAVLGELRDPASTTALAASLGLAASTVSAHLSVLHAAGLVSKQRHDHEVLYWLTPAGRALISRPSRLR